MIDSIKEIFQYIFSQKKWWLAPTLVFLLILGALLIVGGNSTMIPFVYSLF